MASVLHWIILSPFALAGLVPWLHRLLGRRLGWAVLPLPLLAALYFFSLLPAIGGGEILASAWSWAPAYGLEFSVLLDGFSHLFALLISAIGALVVVYAIFYLDPQEDLGRFYLSVLLFMGAMFGVALSENLLTLYVFWELTSFSSFLLIGFWHAREESRTGALKSILVTVAGGFALLAGLILLSLVGGTFSIRELIQQAPVIQAHAFYPYIAILVLVGAFAKSAQVPFHIWLPGAMAAPTPVSAYLHSATMVKAGIFLTAKMGMALGGTDLWFYTVSAVGIATLLLGSLLAVQQTDLKALLAFSTISQLGLIMAAFAYGTPEAVSAGAMHVLSHAAFKGSLFMLVGVIDHQTGTREIGRLSGLGRKMPATAVLVFVGAFAMAGLPPFNGFVSKEMIFEAFLKPPVSSNLFTQLIPWLAVLGSALTMAYCLVLSFKVFSGPSSGSAPVEPREAGWGLLASPAILSGLVVWTGLSPSVAEPTVTAAASALTGGPVSLELALWHGFNWPLAMSLGALIGGWLLYINLGRLLRVLARLRPARFHVNALYERFLIELESIAKGITNRSMTGNLRDYLVFILLFSVVVVGWAMLRAGPFLWPWHVGDWAPISFSEVVALILMIGASLTAASAQRRVTAALAVGAVGVSVAYFWVMWNAPDLALTQVIVETVSMMPIFLAFAYLPKLSVRRSKPAVSTVNVAVAVLLGVLTAALALLNNANQRFASISRYYVETSLAEAGGMNIVNVILVDFRALDTLGELTVLSISAVAVFALVRLRERRKAEDPEAEKESAVAGGAQGEKNPLLINPLILPALSRILFYLAVLFSVYLLFRGHHHPGGGFVAGLMAATALIIWALAFERPEAVRLFPLKDPSHMVASGLLTILALGAGAALQGHPFLTQAFGQVAIPGLGSVELATALLFDIGVWLVVFGAVHWIVVTMSDDTPLTQEDRRRGPKPKAKRPGRGRLHSPGERPAAELAPEEPSVDGSS